MKANCSKEERAERLKCRIEEFLLKKDKQWRRAKDRAKGLFPILTKGTDE